MKLLLKTDPAKNGLGATNTNNYHTETSDKSNNYLCERHVCGNGNSLFRQKPLFLLSEHNFFKLKLKDRKRNFLSVVFSVEHNFDHICDIANHLIHVR